jgi:hypothetical protein
MRESSNQERGLSAPNSLCDSMHTTLATTFTPARLFLSWADQPTVVPGFQIRSTGVSVVVRYVQLHDGARSLRRAHARAMIEQYRLVLLAAGWQVDVVDEPRKMPHLRCSLANDVMSNKGAPCLIS